jgi:riboflavin synthase
VFTGIVETTGIVRAVHSLAQSARIVVEGGHFLDHPRVGDSVAVNGACLTIVQVAGDTFEADLSGETLARTTLGTLHPGDAVNLEAPLALGDRLGGHLVQGHVDGVGRVVRRWQEGDAWWLDVAAPPALTRYIVEKGSIAVDGVSLTVAAREGDRFTICLIPHTCAVTTLGALQPGACMNLEVDILAKYVEQLAAPYGSRGSVHE